MSRSVSPCFSVLAACALLAGACSTPANSRGSFPFPRQQPDNVTSSEDAADAPDAAVAAPDAVTATQPDIVVSDTAVSTSDAATGYDPCAPCVAEDECPTSQRCAQIMGSSYCAWDCSVGPGCEDGSACIAAADTAGQQIQVCVPLVEMICGGGTIDGPDASSVDVVSPKPDAAITCPGYDFPGTPSCCTCKGSNCDPNGCFGGWLCNTKTCKCNTLPVQCGGAPYDAGSTQDTSANCGALDSPPKPSCCACKGTNCALNGCFGGWFCNHDSCKCQPPPDPATCGGVVDVISSPDVAPAFDVTASDAGGSVIPPSGGTLDHLDFAIVGDTRPPSKNGNSFYPTAVITKIWQDVQAELPHLPFAVTTGDYQFSSPSSNNAAIQLDLYLAAQKNFTGTVFHTLGNHECTGATASNCGPGNADGMPLIYQTFLQKMLVPLGVQKPYYSLHIQAKDGSWTAKFVFVAANAWDAEQFVWLEQQMAQPTTYTFVMRHEASYAAQAPGVSPSGEIIKKYPYTLLIAGHTHTLTYSAPKRELVVGNGGAPLATGVNYGYVVARQRPDLALEFNAYDYVTHAVVVAFAVNPDGSTAK